MRRDTTSTCQTDLQHDSRSPSAAGESAPARRWAPRRLFALVGVLLFAATTAGAGGAPDFKLKDLKGKWFRLGDHVGEDVIYITYWATWCVPCRREMPHLQEMYKKYEEDGLLVLAVNTDPAANHSKVKPWVNRHKLSFPVVLDQDNNVLDKYNPTRGLPYGVRIDKQGYIHKTFAGYRTGEEMLLEEEVMKLLDVPSDGEGEAAEEASAQGAEQDE